MRQRKREALNISAEWRIDVAAVDVVVVGKGERTIERHQESIPSM